jgi:hypothetical protein
MIGTNVKAQEATVIIDGTGIAWSQDWGSSFSSPTIVKNVPIHSTMELNINGLQVQWELHVTIAEIGYDETFILDNTNGSLEMDPTNRYAHIWTNRCWGGEYCPRDNAQPDATGNSNIDLKINLTTLKGYININYHNNNQNNGSSINLLGEVILKL